LSHSYEFPITVKEISKDGTENVELPWEELEEDTQNSDTEKDTKIFYTDELEAFKVISPVVFCASALNLKKLLSSVQEKAY